MDGAKRSGRGMAGPGGWMRTGEFSGIGGCRKMLENQTIFCASYYYDQARYTAFDAVYW